jgi:hypothetical protein
MAVALNCEASPSIGTEDGIKKSTHLQRHFTSDQPDPVNTMELELLLDTRVNDERPDSAKEAPAAGELGVAEPASDKSLSIVITLTTLGGNHPNLEGSLPKRPSHQP